MSKLGVYATLLIISFVVNAAEIKVNKHRAYSIKPNAHIIILIFELSVFRGKPLLFILHIQF